MGLGTAFRAFFVALGGSDRSIAIRRILDKESSLPLSVQPSSNQPASTPPGKAKSIGEPTKPPPRSEAIDLLAALQRESRLIDLVSEPLDGFSDAQIGAAARPCLKQTAQVLHRLFELAPISTVAEGTQFELPDPWSPVRYQVIGGHADRKSVV